MPQEAQNVEGSYDSGKRKEIGRGKLAHSNHGEL